MRYLQTFPPSAFLTPRQCNRTIPYQVRRYPAARNHIRGRPSISVRHQTGNRNDWPLSGRLTLAESRHSRTSTLNELSTLSGHSPRQCIVCERPKAGSCSSKGDLFDHLVGELRQVRPNLEAEHFRRFEIDDLFELGRRLRREVGRSFTFEDTVDVPSRARNCVDTIRSIRDHCPFHSVQSRKLEELSSWWPGRK